MTKTHTKIGARNPFIPSWSPVCRAADWLLIGGVTIAGIAAGIASVVHQLGAMQ